MSKKFNLSGYQYIFFDFDGVIKDSVNIKGIAFKNLFDKYGTEVSDKVYNHHLSNGGMSRFEKIPIYLSYAKEKITDKIIIKFLNDFSDTVCQKVIKSDWIYGVNHYLEDNYLKQTFIIITATPQAEIEYILSELNIKHFFYKIYGSPSKKNVSISKFNNENNLNLNNRNSIVVGDSETDYDAAMLNNLSYLQVGKKKYDSSKIDAIDIFCINNFSQVQ